MKNYVISLPNATLRREHIRKEFTEKGVNFEFFDAFSPSERMEKMITELIPSLGENSTLTNGEKGCLLSHLALWKKCIDENLEYISIFEDDVLISPDLQYFLKDCQWIENKFNKESSFIIRYETYKMPVKLSSLSEMFILNRQIKKLQSAHWGTAGYIINRKMAEYLLNFFIKIDKNNIPAIDKVIFDILLNNNELLICQFSPALCIQEVRQLKDNSKLLSDIGDRSNQKDKEKSKSFYYKLIKEFKRIKRKINYKIKNFEVIPFE